MTGLLTRRKRALILLAYLALCLAAMAVAPLFGAEAIDPAKAFTGLISGSGGIDTQILFFHRMPRVVLAVIVGGSLAMAGSGLQVILKNPLAEPYILGIAGAGAVGAALASTFPGLVAALWFLAPVELASLAGCLAAAAAVAWLASGKRPASATTILLAGVTFNIICAALILLARYLASPHQLFALDRWLMGGLDALGYARLLAVLPLFLPGAYLLMACALELNQLSLGEAMASGQGIDVARVRRRVLLGSGLVTAAAVSMAGPIGFVGLIVPHAVRRMSGRDARLAMPASFLAGGAFLVLSDLLARTLAAPAEMPVGIITAVVGGPIFLKILFSRRGRTL